MVDAPAEQTGSEQKKPKANDVDKEVLRGVGRALWRTELPSQATVEEKKASWTENRRKYTNHAKKLMRAFAKESITLTKNATTAEAAEQ